jgi:hypothetical protein
MIDALRRRFRKSIDKDPWNANQGLKPEFEENVELRTDTAPSVATPHASGKFSPLNENTPDYYKSLVATAIQNGGRLGDHQIPIPWLRMILAGLELKHIEPEMMWYGVESGSSSRGHSPGIPSYNVLFPSDRNVLTGLGLE